MLRESGESEVPEQSRGRLPSDTPSRMPGTILVPVDFTAVSLKAMDHALTLAKRINASIVLLHVLDPFYTSAFMNLVTRQKVRREARGRALQMIQEFAAARMDRGVPIKCVVRDGVPEYEILRFAEAEDVDLIALGRRPRNPLSRLLVGSLNDDVADLSSCPVLIVNSRASTPRRNGGVANEGSGIVSGSM